MPLFHAPLLLPFSLTFHCRIDIFMPFSPISRRLYFLFISRFSYYLFIFFIIVIYISFSPAMPSAIFLRLLSHINIPLLYGYNMPLRE